VRYGNASVRQGIAAVLSTIGIYAIVFGFGVDRRLFIVLGCVLLVLAVVAWFLRVVPRSARAYVHGTAQVTSVTPAPDSGAYGRCQLELRCTAPGLPDARVTVRDSRVPVAKWPEVGATLPVLIDVDDPRRVRIRWDEVLTHAEVASDEMSDQDPDAPLFIDDDPYAARYEDPPSPLLSDEEFAALTVDDYFPSPPRRVLPLEDEPSTLVARYLFPTERYRGEWRRHYVSPATTYLAILTLALLGVLATPNWVSAQDRTEVIGAICVAGAVISLYCLTAWRFGLLVLTDKRLMLVQGVLRRRVSAMALTRLTDFRFQQTTFGRLLNYGDFVVEGASWFSHMRRVTALPNPNELYLRICEEFYDPRAVEARLGSYDDLDDEYDLGRSQP
jgi:hypothetical protein